MATVQSACGAADITRHPSLSLLQITHNGTVFLNALTSGTCAFLPSFLLFLLLQLLRLQVDRLRQGEDKDELVKQLKDDHDKQVKQLEHDYKELTKCKACKETPLNSALPCGHVYCRACLVTHFKRRNHGCPTCNRGAGEKDIIRLYLGF